MSVVAVSLKKKSDSADWIVDPEPLDERHRDDRNAGGNEADHHRGPGRDESTRGGDGDERREDTVQHHRDVRLAEDEPRDADPAEPARRCGEVRRQRDIAEEADPAAADDAERRARVEA